MFAVRKDTSGKEGCPNLLPCSIRHDGPVAIDEKYWNPTTNTDGSQTAYFRGRKLFGREVRLPEGYEGVLLKKSDRTIISRPEKSCEVPGEEELEVQAAPTRIAEDQATFERMVIWGHEVVPSEDSQHVKAIQEWISFAESMHCTEDQPK